MRFIGDVHGKFRRYERLITGVTQSIQVGDMGIGFGIAGPDGGIEYPSPPYGAMKREGSHRFIRGNHDNPAECRNQSLCIADGHGEDEMFFCGGALSAGRARRTEGVNRWPDEELSVFALERICEKYLDEKPKIMVTHDGPHSIAETILRVHQPGKSVAESRTRRFLQSMWERHRPETWIFGHWHLSADMSIAGTRFICLNELEAIDF